MLLVVERADEAAWLSARNLPQVHILEAGQLNTYDVLVSDDVVFTKAAFERFVAVPRSARPRLRDSKGATPDERADRDRRHQQDLHGPP